MQSVNYTDSSTAPNRASDTGCQAGTVRGKTSTFFTRGFFLFPLMYLFTSLQFLQAQTSVANRTVSDAQYCGTSTYYTVWIAPKSGSTLSSYNRVNWGTFTEYSNGTASFQGEVYNVNNTNTKWTVNVTFSGRTYSTPANSPKPHMCGSPGTSDWYYYTSFSGTLTGSGNLAGTQLSLTNTGPSFQVGTGANVADLLFGASGWYNYSVVSANNYYYSHYCGSSGDFNFRLSGTSLPPTCQNLTSAGSIGSNESVCGTSFNPTLINSLSLPSGGGIGTIEYVWLVTTDPATAAGTASNYSVISGATGSTYDPGSITQTTWYRRCARRQGCTTYPAETNWVKKELYPCPATCSNVTSGGTIGNNESICGTSFDPANIINVTSPSGGSGTLEYMWLLTTDPNTAAGTASNWTAISGANGATYDPGVISQTTWYRRCSRRSGCSAWNGESNWVKKEITGCQNVTSAGSIGYDETVCGTSLDPALIQSIALPSGGCTSSAIEYVWLMTTDPGTPAGTSWNVTVVSGANGPTYDPGTITQTTWYRRCSRRAGCSSYDGESNWVKKELLNNCCPTISVLNPNPPSATIISGQTVSSICVNTTAVSGTSIRFLYFTSSQINPYTASGGTLISTVTPSGGSACANNISFPANNTGSNVSYYVYAILNPTPSDPACRPFQQFVITVTPGCSNVTSPGTIGYTQTNCGPFDPALIQSITLPSGGAGTIEYIWLQAAPQDTANSGAWGVISGATGASYDPGFISQSTCYRRCARRSGCTSYVGETHWVCKIVTPIPGTPTVTGNTTVCEGNTTTLTASGCNGGTLNWYTVATGGSPVSSSATFTTPVLNATTNYYVDCTVSGCTGARTMVTISVTPNPAAPSVTDGSRCGPGTVDLSASGCTGGQIKWFATPTSTNIINTGTVYTTVSLSVTTTYYVECHLNGCKSARVPVVATINAIPATPVLSATQPSCGVSTGSITVTSPSGGLFEYSFDNGATYQVSNSKSGLSSGVYQIVVRRISTGCISASSSATINPSLNVPATPVLSLIQPDCNNATGSITVTSPTASNYEYSFDNGVTYQSTPVLSGLAPGTYQVKIKDINSGCISVATAGVLNNIAPVPTPVVTVTQPSCSSATGSVTVTSPTGTGIVYSFDNGATYQSNPTKSGLVAGNYYVLAKNNNTGCISPANYVTINNSPIPSASASSSPVCAGESIQLNATASVASPGTITAYNWTGPNGYTSGMEDPVIASATVAMSGNYTVTVTTSAGCTATASVNVTVNALPSAPSVSVSQPNCTSGTGSITVTAPVSGVMYSFDNGVTFQTSATRSGLGAGSYDIVVKSNATGCVSLPTVAVINPQPGTPTVTAGSNSPICSGNTITLTANASIASGTITGYTWTGPNGFNSSLQNPTIPNATVAASGLYTVAVTTSAGCTGSDATSVTVNALPNSGINAGSTICALEGTLYQAINPQPGDTYNWSFGGFATPSSSTASSVTVTYSVGAVGTTQTATLVVTNAEGCVSTYTHNINVTQNVFANAGSDQTICQGANVTLGGSPAGPSGATYVWTPNLFLNNNTLANPTSTPPSTIIYTLTVTLNGCVRTDQVVASVNVNNNPDADAGADKDICQGGSVVIGGSPTSSQPSSTYLWSPATGLSATNIANPTANPSATTVYQVIVTNQFGCKDTDMVVVTVNLLPSTPSVAASQPTCTIATGTITVNSPLGSNFEYSFDGGSTYQASNVKSGLTAGTYQVIVRNVNTQCISSAVSETINAQPVNCLSVGDIVFNDENNNGVQDGSEAGVPGVTVNLYADANNDGTPDGPAIATTTTNANGEYIFSGLVTGTYIVGIIAPGGYASSSGTVGSATGPYEPGQDPDNNINNDDNGTTQSGNLILSGPITLTIGGEPTNDGDLDANTNLTVDFGIFQALSLGNLVWEDVNNDGLFNNAESGIANILVYLYTDNNLDNIPDGPAVATTTTNASGNYSFVYLTPGNYIVGVNGAGYMSSSGQNASETGPYEPAPDPDNDVNDDDNGNNQGVNPILLSSTVTLSVNGESVIDGDTDANTNLTVDFGLFHPAKIGNFVWNDLDRDGIQDPGEPGIPNVQVNLYDSSNNLIATTSTDVNGYYLFANIIAGTYVVQFDPTSFPPGYAVSPQDATGDALDSDPNVTTGFTAPITLTYGQVNNDIDAGLNCPLPNATIASNSPVCIGGTITLTGTGGGSYLWSGPNGFSANSALASVPNASLANSGLYNLTVTNAVCGASVQLSTNVTVNPGPASGINGPASICALEDALFQSTNPQPGNTYSWNFGSLATPSSSNASSATIQYSAAAVGTTQTIYLTVSTANNCTETYSWAVNVTPAVFANGGPDKTICQGASTQIGGAPSGPSGATYVWTPNLFLNSNSVSNPMATPPSTITYTLTVTLNGCVRTDQITVNVDVNLNPIADAGQDKAICQGSATGVQIGGAPTSNQPGFISWSPATGLSNAFTANPVANPATTTTYQVIVNNNFGCPDTDYVVVTVNPLPSAPQFTVVNPTCTNATGTITVTSPAGNYEYSFDNGVTFQASATSPALASGTYQLKVKDLNTGCISNVSTAVIAPQPQNCLSIGNLVWEDTNNDGLLNGTETGKPGVTVYLYEDTNNDGTPDGGAIATTTTNASGNYLFGGLVPGTYIVGILTPSGYISSSGTNASASGPYETAPDPDNDINNDDNGTSNSATVILSQPVTLSTGGESVTDGDTDSNTNLTVDFGIYQPSSIGNFVWNDLDRDGVQDSGESGIPNVQVQLLDGSGNPILVGGNPVIVTTNASGTYTFNNLAPGSYSVQFLPASYPAGFGVSPQDATADNLDSDANTVTGVSSVVTIGSGQTYVDLDAGLNCILPNVDAGPDTTLTCTNATVVITGSSTTPGVTYSWTGPNGYMGGNTSTTVIIPGTYVLTVTSIGGCSSSDTVIVDIDQTPPTADAGPDQTLTCSVTSVTIGTAAVSGNSYSWNTGATTAQISVTTPGTYTLTVTDNANGCTSTDAVVVNQNITPPTADAGPDQTLTCSVTSVTIGTAAVSGNSYSWNTGATTAQITVTTPGTYTLTVTDNANGCTSTDAVVVNQNITPPTADAGPDQTLTCSVTSVTIGTAAVSGNSYSWNTGATTAQITVTTPGTYTLTVTDNANGCTSTDAVVVNQNITPPTADAGPDQTLTCSVTSVTIGTAAVSGNSYSWNTGATTAQISVTTPGTYTLTVTDNANGCTSTDAVVVNQNITPPTADAGPDQTLTCSVTSVTIGTAAVSGNSYSWNTGATTAQISVTTPGTYTLTVTDNANGCTSTDAVVVNQNITPPTADAGPDQTLTCSVTSVTIGTAAVSGNSYSWNTGATTAQISVTTPGTYTLTVTDNANGCTSTDAVVVNQNITPPTADAGPDQTLTCSVTSVTIGTAAVSGNSYSWNTGATTAQISVSTPGTYTLTVTDNANGCTSTDAVVVNQNITPPTADAGPDQTLTCSVTSVTIGTAAVSGNSYSWNTGATTAQISVTTPGTYTLTVTDNANGCTSTDAVVVNQNITPPTADAGPDQTLTCSVTSVTIGTAAVSGNSYSWNTGATTAQISVTTPGTYTLTVTDNANGCTSTDAVVVNQNITPPTADAGPDQTLTCSVTSVTIGTAAVSGNSYSWNTGATTAQISVTTPGTYTLTVTDNANGCTSTDAVVVNQNITPPTADAGPDQTLTCSVTSVTIGTAAVSGNSYSWNTGATTAQISVTTPGTYTLTVTDNANGCTSTDAVVVNQNITPPTADTGPDQTLTCSVTSVTIGTAAVSGNSYSWNTGATTAQISVTTPGTYTLTVTDNANGCTSTDAVVVNQNITPPTADAGPDQTLTCSVTSVTIGTAAVSGNSYSWNTGATTAQISVTTPGTYTLTVTDNANGCTSTDAVVVNQNITPPTADAGPDQTLTCSVTSVTIGTAAVSGNSYSWNTGATTAQISVSTPGTYTLTVTDNANGCTSTDAVVVNQNITPPTADAGPDQTLTCSVTSVTIGTAAVSGNSYSWNTGATTAQISVSTPGTYTLTVTDNANGCTSTDAVVVNQNITPPTADAGPDQTLTCSVTSVTIGTAAVSGNSYSWNTGATTAQISVTTPGTYTLTVTDNANGCTSTDAVVVNQNITPPTADAGSDQTLTCSVTSVTIGTAAVSGNSYSWNTGATTAQISVSTPGTYTLTVTDNANGCTSTDAVVVNQNITPPTADAGPDQTLTCSVTSVTIGTAAVSGNSYSWNTGATTAQISVTTPGTYTLTVTDNANGCTSTDAVVVNQNITPPTADAGADQVICNGGSIQLNGTSNGVSYSWSPATGLSATNILNPVANPVVTTAYTLTTTGANGCINSDNVTVTVNSTPDLSATIPGQTYCLGNVFNLSLISVVDANNTGGTITFHTDTPPTAANQVSGSIILNDTTTIYVLSTTSNNCFDITSVTINPEPCKAFLGDRVWNDTDKDGIQDATEVGVSGVTVTLYKDNGSGTYLPVATTLTDAFGNYLFAIGQPGSYKVGFTLPTDYVFSPKDATTDANDSDPNTLTGLTDAIAINYGDDIRTVDAGVYYTTPNNASIGDYVWLDQDSDGIQDATEPGFANVTVTLYNAANQPVATTVTNSDGYYQFTNLPAGNYTVGVSLPAGYAFSPVDATADNLDSDINPTTGKTATITLAAGEVKTTVDAGIKPANSGTASVGDFVWNDLNQNGIQDAGEPGVGGITAQLFNFSNVLVASTVTNEFGYYMFTNVNPGSYYVKFITPAGYSVSPQDAGDDNADSDIFPGTKQTNFFGLSAGEVLTTIDAGIYLTTPPGTASAGDYVWYDLNENGVQDANETGVPGVTVTLYNATTNAVVKTTATDNDGFYRFTGLPAGSYYVGFSNLPLDYQFTTQTTGTANGSDANTSSGLTPSFTLVAAQYNSDLDAGIIRRPVEGGKASLGNFVWNDLNNNGVQDAGEPGVPNVTVTLYQADGVTVIKTTTTDGQGEYIFNDLAAGQYVVGFGLPSGFGFAPANATADDKDSDANTGTGKTGVIALATGEANLTVDAGIFNPAATGIIGDFVWNDVNGNGVQDPGEPGIPGVTVTLYDATTDTPVGVAVTDDNGIYQIIGVPNGTYYVVFSNQPDGFTFTTQGNGTPSTDSDPDSDGRTPTFTFSGGTKNDVDAGLQSARAAIGNYVWFDTDRDGVQDSGEEGVTGVTVTLFDNTNTAIANAVTDANGYYYFLNINPGTYTLGFSTLPSNVVFTAKDSPSGTDATDSDVNPSTGLTDAFTVNAGDVNYTFDAGIYTKIVSSLEGVAWSDVDRDGQRDPNELPVAGVTVILYDGGIPVAATVTDGNGGYVFNDIAPGNNYTVGFSTLPPNTTISPQNQGSDLTDSDPNPSTGITNPIIVPEGVSVKNNDIGIMPPAGAIGNYVWIDTDGNGIQNEAATNGINGVTVQLWNPGGDLFSGTADDELITSTVTANDGSGNPGYYLFDGLYFGYYYVRFPVVNSIGGLTVADQGANDGLDSDPNRFTGNTEVVVISPDSTGIKRFNLTLDAGFKPSAPLCPGICFEQDTLVYADTLSRRLFDIGSEPMILPQFDPSLGTLSYAEIEAEIRVNLDYTLENLGSLPRIIKIQTDGSIVVTGPGLSSGLNNTYNVIQTVDTLAKTDGVFGSGPDYTSADSVPVRQTYKDAILASLAPFIGTGELNYTVDGIANSTVIGSGTLSSLILTYGEVVLRVRYVYCRTVCGKVGDYVWNDENTNGIQDQTETGVAGVTVTLYNNVNQPVASTSSDAQGAYAFNNVFPGNYSVGITLPATYAFTLADQGGNDNTDSDINPVSGRSAVFAVNALQDVSNVDAGIYVSQSPRITIGNRIWNDVNSDGLQGTTETGLANVVVELYDNSGNLQRCTSTDANGNYEFADVNPGTYRMRVACPVGYIYTAANVGSNEALDNDVETSTGFTQPFTATSGQSILDCDAGLRLQAANRGSIGDLVWNDLNKDGIYASSEPGMSGVSVTLLDLNNNVLSQTSTDIFGKYIFNDLAGGSYRVRVTPPTGYAMSPKTTTANANQDNDFNATGLSDIVILASGNKRITIDAAMNNLNPAGTAKVGNYVWNDLNQNGVQETGESGVAGVMVSILNATNDAVVQTTMTKSNGTYQFVELAAGSYKVKFFNIPVTKQFTVMGVGSAGANSDANPATGITSAFTLNSGQTNNAIDAGLIPTTGRASTITMGDYVWNDLNNNGIQEYGEPGMGNVQVNLTSTDGVITKQTATDATGHYIFNDLQQGNYILTFSNLPSGYSFVAKNQTDVNRDSDVNPATGQTDEIALSNGQSALHVDAGVFNPTATATIGNTVWNDKDRNGVQDGTEIGLPGITVTLYNTANQPVQSTVSDVDGKYLLVGVPEGAYKVEFSNIPEGFFFTDKNIGNDILDSDADVTSGMTEVFYLVSGQGKSDLDAGIYTDRAAIGNYVWADANNNGLQDVNETGFAGITVKLLNDVNEAVSTAVTDANGRYQFVNILPGQYKVCFSNLPGGAQFANPDANNNLNDLEDSDVNPETGLTPFFTVALGDVAYNWDAGIYVQPKGELVGNVWVDTNNDGLQTDGESGVAGVAVNLYNMMQELVTTSITNEEGIYLFSELTSGDYEVIFTNLPEGATYTQSNVNGNANDSTDSDILDVITGSAGIVTIGAGEAKDGPDAGLITPAGISGIAFSDDNNNGIRDAGETGIANVIVSLYDASGQVVGTTETDGDGNYAINTIEIGATYQLGFSEIPLRDFTAMNAGNDDMIDSDVADKTAGNTVKGRTLMMTPFVIGEMRTNLDAGYLRAGQSLPDETVVLSAELVNNDGLLNWITNIEWNGDYFEVQRSLDGSNFTEIINTKDAVGYSMTPTEYTDTDAAVGSLGVSKVYYRIKMLDTDGTFKYSNVAELPLNQEASDVYMNVYPIPATNDIFVDYQLLGATVASIRIVNPLGQVLYEEDLDPNVPSRQLHYDVREWAKGVYYFEIYTETSKVTQKVVVQ